LKVKDTEIRTGNSAKLLSPQCSNSRGWYVCCGPQIFWFFYTKHYGVKWDGYSGQKINCNRPTRRVACVYTRHFRQPKLNLLRLCGEKIIFRVFILERAEYQLLETWSTSLL